MQKIAVVLLTCGILFSKDCEALGWSKAQDENFRENWEYTQRTLDEKSDNLNVQLMREYLFPQKYFSLPTNNVKSVFRRLIYFIVDLDCPEIIKRKSGQFSYARDYGRKNKEILSCELKFDFKRCILLPLSLQLMMEKENEAKHKAIRRKKCEEALISFYSNFLDEKDVREILLEEQKEDD